MSVSSSTTTTASPQGAMQPAPQSSGLANLPPDVLINILGMLPIQQFGALNLTCRQFCFITRNHPLTLLLSQHFPNFQKTDPNQTELEALKEQYLINSNLPKGVYASHTLQAHKGTVWSLALKGQTLFSSSKDKTIKLWDLNTNTHTATLQGHKGAVYSLKLDGQRLFSGSSDSTIKIWDLNTNTCTATLQGHNDSVWSIALDGQRLFSSSQDKTIKIWDLNANTCTATLQGHIDGVFSLALDGQRLFSSSSDSTIMIWDLITNTCTATLEEHDGPVLNLALGGQRLFSSSSDRTIKIWDLNTNTCTATLQGHNGSVENLALDGQRLFSGSADGTMKIWDLNTNTCTATLKAPNTVVTSLRLSGQKLFSGSEKGIIKIWDFNAPDEAVFKEIADLLKSKDSVIAKDAMARFERMPPKAKNAIYGELYLIMAPLANDTPGCAEHAFHNENGQSSTPEQRAQAILNYLAKSSEPIQDSQ